jgi:hypothetical protein
MLVIVALMSFEVTVEQQCVQIMCVFTVTVHATSKGEDVKHKIFIALEGLEFTSFIGLKSLF